MKAKILKALEAYYKGEIAKAKMNVEVFLENSTGVGEHSDILETISVEVAKIAQFEDNLNALEKHFYTQEINI